MFKQTKVSQAVGVALSGVVALAALPAFAQDSQRIEITGSSIKRALSDAALPVQVITREEIARTGAISTEQLIQTISSSSTLGGLTVTQGAGLSIYGRSEVSLRGLGSERTLVLVNGRRISPHAAGGGAAVDVNSIPLAAIERVEVLTDGASSVYGSDAMGGVMNFILTKNFQGIQGDVSYGTPTRSGGGQNSKVSIVGGIGDGKADRFNLTISAMLEKEKQLRARDRSFAETGNNFPYTVAGATGQGNIEGGFNVGTGSVATNNWVEGTRVSGFGNSPGAAFGNPLAAQDKCADINMFKNPTKTSKGAPFCAFDSSRFVDGLVPERESTALSANGTFRLTDKVELFGDALYSKNVNIQRIQTSPVRRSFLTSDGLFQELGVDPALLIFPANPNYLIATTYLNGLLADPAVSAATKTQIQAILGKPLAITARVTDFGPRTSKDTSEQSRFVLGARGAVFGQDYEVAYSTNQSKVAGTVIDGYFSQVGFAKIVQTSNDWNPWSLQQTAAFIAKLPDAKYIGPTLNAKAKGSSLDGVLRGDAFALPAGMSQYAVGAQFHDAEIVTSPSPALETGDIAGLGGGVPPINRSRKITSFFGELNVPILKGLEGNVSMRNDDYNDVGRSNTWKANMRWQPMTGVVLRASSGTGFRAPTLSDLWTPQTVGTSAQFTDPAFPTTPNLQVPELSGGNPDVKPETSKQSSIGMVFSPMRSLSIGIDFWRININNIISTPSTQEIVTRFRQGDPAYQGLVILSPSGDVDQTKSILANVGSAKVAGTDLNVDFREKFGAGQLALSLNGTYMSKYDQTTPGGTLSHKVGTIVDPNGDPVLDADTGGVVLRWKHYLAATWTQGPWGFTLAQNFYTGYETGNRQIDGERNFTGDQAIYDANVTYSGIKNLNLTLGVKNLFDKNPPIFVPVSNQFQAGYDVTQYDARARFVYVRASYKFF